MKTKLKKIWNTPITGAQLYLLAFAIYFIPAFLIDSLYTNYISWSKLRLLTYLAIPILIFKIYVMDRWRWPTKLFITGLILFSVIAWRASRYPELMVTMVFVWQLVESILNK